MAAETDISVVVPVFNEQDSLPILQRELTAVLEGMGCSWEVIYVDDSSTDRSLRVMLDLRRLDRRVRVIKFRRNSGQTAAVSAGFDHSRGRVVVTMDGDLQNDPEDIPRLVRELDAGHDVVAGWRKQRRDAFVLRRLPSIVANRLIALVTGVSIHDTGCTLKAFRRELVRNLPIYAEQHRFLPVMSKGSGARVAEIVVNHRERRYGTSKYGIGRATRVLLDLLSVKLITQFSQRPLQYFGMLSISSMGFAFAFALFGLVGREPDDPTAPRGAWFISEWESVVVGCIMMMISLMAYFGLLGLLGELVVKASGMHRRGILDRILNELH